MIRRIFSFVASVRLIILQQGDKIRRPIPEDNLEQIVKAKNAADWKVRMLFAASWFRFVCLLFSFKYVTIFCVLKMCRFSVIANCEPQKNRTALRVTKIRNSYFPLYILTITNVFLSHAPKTHTSHIAFFVSTQTNWATELGNRLSGRCFETTPSVLGNSGTAGRIHFLYGADDFRPAHGAKLQLGGAVRAETSMLARFYPDRGLHVEAQRAGIFANAQLAQLLEEQVPREDDLILIL